MKKKSLHTPCSTPDLHPSTPPPFFSARAESMGGFVTHDGTVNRAHALHASVLGYHTEVATHFSIAVAFSIVGELEHVKSHRRR